MPSLLASPFALVALSVAAAAAIVLGIDRFTRRRQLTLLAAQDDSLVFLFSDGVLVDATAPARRLVDRSSKGNDDLGRLIATLSRRFPGLADAVAADTGPAPVLVAGETAGESATVDRWGDVLRITLHCGDATDPVDRLRLRALEDETAVLRAIAEDSPQLIWKQDANGAVIWANTAYLGMADRLANTPQGVTGFWPARPLFADLRCPDTDGQAETQRVALNLPEPEPTRWFAVTTVRRAGQIIGFAVDATGIVAAETARRDFVQTLTKTFASLRAGLAVFDRQRRLALFNPALIDLTGLKGDFLSARPTVHAVLDRLRDMHMLPEPKDYVSWREQVAALEAAAVSGTYCENWVLPGGQTYRVTGRPHPDGAIAFLFEDISDEVSLARHFRSGQEAAQAVLDSLDQAIAVFSVAGTLTLSNRAYDQLWGSAAAGLGDCTLADEMQVWRGRCAATPAWDRIARFFTPGTDRTGGSERLHLADGRVIEARFEPLPAGATLAEFREPARTEPLTVVPGGSGAGPEDPTAGDLRDTGT